MADPVMLRFRRSLYVSLALACICLTYAEWLYLPGTLAFSLLIGALLTVCYRCEDRWSLSLRAANALGAVIAISAVVWIAANVLFPNRALNRLLPWPLILLPLLSPLVLVIIPAKLLRPKHNGDYWGLQLIGLMAVTLGCALASDGWVAGLAVVYLFAAVRCVLDFHAVLVGGGHSRAERSGPEHGAGWLLLSMAVAFVLALLTPRISDARWEYGSIANRLQTGISDSNPSIDINSTGELRSSSEEAFRVTATTNNGQPKLDLSPEQRWRGLTFDFYELGKWSNRDRRRENPQLGIGKDGSVRNINGIRLEPLEPTGASVLPNLGPHQYYLSFRFPTNPHPVFYLAMPLWSPHVEGGRYFAPVCTEGANRRWWAKPEGDIIPPPPSIVAGYRQVTAPTPEPNLSSPVVVEGELVEHLSKIYGLSALRRFADVLLHELIAKQQLPPHVLTHERRIQPEHHEVVARAFEKYLETSGQFESSFSLDRTDPNLDPVEDFVLNQRRGHCNRFATALTLLLRCHGIPSRIVLGYHGAESQGDGTYIVRQSHAHSWVECLIRRRTATGEFTWHWLTLDATPAQVIPAAGNFAVGPWIEGLQARALDLVSNLLVELTPERQAALLANLNPITWNIWLLATIVTGATVWLLNRRRQSRRTIASAASPYERLIALLRERRVLKVSPAWTPNELLSAVSSKVQQNELTSAAARIVADQNHRRFGGRVADAAHRLDNDLKLLRRDMRRSAGRRG